MITGQGTVYAQLGERRVRTLDYGVGVLGIKLTEAPKYRIRKLSGSSSRQTPTLELRL